MKKIVCALIILFSTCAYALTPAIVGLVSQGGDPPADVTVYPTTDDATYDAWTASSGLDKYAMVDDVAGAEDGDTTYIWHDSASQTQRFSNRPVSLPSGTILAIRIYFTAKEMTTNWGIEGVIRVNGTSYYSAEQALTTSYAEYYVEWATNPNTSSAWLKADAEGDGSNPLQNWGLNPETGVSNQARATATRLVVRYN